jgi:hypothetical protein
MFRKWQTKPWTTAGTGTEPLTDRVKVIPGTARDHDLSLGARMANAAGTFDLQIPKYGAEIMVNAGMTGMESALRGEEHAKRNLS